MRTQSSEGQFPVPLRPEFPQEVLNGEIPSIPRGEQRALDAAPLEPRTMAQLGGRERGKARGGWWGPETERRVESWVCWGRGALALPPFGQESLSSPQSLPLTLRPMSALSCPLSPKVTNHSSLLEPGRPSPRRHRHALKASLSSNGGRKPLQEVSCRGLRGPCRIVGSPFYLSDGSRVSK